MENKSRNKHNKWKPYNMEESPEMANLEFADENEFMVDGNLDDLERRNKRRIIRKPTNR
jgi:hypothetical protein